MFFSGRLRLPNLRVERKLLITRFSSKQEERGKDVLPQCRPELGDWPTSSDVQTGVDQN